ncbi:hypothetical protein QFC22_001029 [Naganishia vaughanmartiniae]|uniref:Uncharacterized protein n=1 Tax=Naganishia vaughanmartiniae TaxID=1424756 RepID=A0ACC2XLI0_9TREE|nr:hypothetical protein QFC22_001029 [Naganishia vaughanmartiniae]
MASPNAAPTWASQDQDSDEQNQDPPLHKRPTIEVQEELDVMAASSAVGSPSSVGKHERPAIADKDKDRDKDKVVQVEMETDELDVDDAAELARNQAAEALNDLANAAVALSSTPIVIIKDTNPALPIPSAKQQVKPESPIPAAPVTSSSSSKPAATTTKQRRRPAALLTPTRQSGLAYRSPLVPSNNTDSSASTTTTTTTITAGSSSAIVMPGVGLGSVKTEDLQARNIGNGEKSIGSDKPGGGPSGRSAFNSPFTNQPFMATPANDAAAAAAAAGVPVINTGTRKDVPTYHVLRKEDGEMCTRADLQYDFLHHLFSNPVQAFSIPAFQDVPRKYNPATRAKLTFNELYCYTLASSKRSTKQLKEALLDLEPGAIPGKHQAGKAYRTRKRGELSKSGTAGTDSVNASPGPEALHMVDELSRDEPPPEEVMLMGGGGGGGGSSAVTDPTTVDGYDGLRDSYAKICLLVNVGRINTTFAFYPAMRTVLRTYHSVPSLQKTLATRKSLQDAPRMKNALKAIRVATEPDDVELPASLQDVLDRLHAGDVPPTSVVNLIFLLGLGQETVTDTFFAPGNIVDRHNLLAARATQPGSVNENGKLHILNLFTVINIPSTERARMFLYILYHYLESDTGPNPFADPDRPGEPPLLHVLNDEEYASLGENIDEEEELEWGAEMRARRIESLKELALQKQSALNTPGGGALHVFNTASAATSARNSIEPSSTTFPYRPSGGTESFDANSDRHSDVGTDASSRKRKRYSPLALESTLSAATARSLRAGGDASRPPSRQVSPESVRAFPPTQEALASAAPSARASPHDTHYDSRFPSRSQSQTRSRVSPHAALRGATLPDLDISDYEDDAPKTVILGRRDRNDPRAMQDDWAHGVDISGLDEETVRLLIHQVNLEFGDPPAPEPEIIWKESEKGPSSYDEQRRNMDEELFARQDSRRISYGNGHAEVRPLISPSREAKNHVGDAHSVQSSHSPAFSHREPQQERHPSANNGLGSSTSTDRLPVSPPARKTNSLSALLN